MEISHKTFEFIFHHVFLPPKLPKGEDWDTKGEEQTLLNLFHKSAMKYVSQVSAEDSDGWQPILVMLQSWVRIEEQHRIRKDELNTALKELKIHEIISFYVRAQNSGIILRRVNELLIVVDAFEASPSNDAVMTSKGRLVRDFPGSSVSFRAALLQDDHFRGQISESLDQMAVERIPECMPKTRKAKSAVLEERDTINPGFVIENFLNILRAVGGSAEIDYIQKHLRDDVVLYNSRIPWRRSPLWLVLKVALQSALKFRFPKDPTNGNYKNFMLFFLSSVTRLAADRPTVSDMLTIMKAKVGRRSYKLHDYILPFVSQSAMDAVRAASASVEGSWKIIQKMDSTFLPSLHQSAVGKTILSLSNSKQYLETALSRSIKSPDKAFFKPESASRMHLGKDGLPIILPSSNSLDRVLILADIERWAEKHSKSWSTTTRTDRDCTALASLIEGYMKLAIEEYEDASHELSLSLLTIVELWIILDTICIRLYPLINQFGPEIPKTYLEPLLLPRLGHMKRLQTIEQYLELRNEASRRGNPSIFAEPQNRSFAVQYYDSSEKHGLLRQKIEDDAQTRRDKKMMEWQEKETSYNSLKQRESNLTHDTAEDEVRTPYHPYWCKKCELERDYQRIYIEADEWPLPEDPLMVKSVIFELDCPEGFIAWRDTTWALIHDLGRKEHVSGQPMMIQLLEYGLLKNYSQKARGQRLTLGSVTKSFLKAHYKAYKFPVNIESLCVKNGLQYHFLDSKDPSANEWIADQTSEPCIARHCQTDLPLGPYANLQDTVNHCTHTHNEVIARQATCSPELDLSEFIAFGSLRCGEHIQWLNILRELGSPTLSFNQLAVSQLIAQAAHQAGSSHETGPRRLAHRVFMGHAFCTRLLDMLERIRERIQANWKEQQTMGTLIVISLRIISLTLESEIRKRAVDLVILCRRTAMRWCTDLDAMLNDGRSDRESEKTRLMILKGASLCQSTYDVDEDHIDAVLNSNDDVADLVECSVLICDNTPECINSLPKDVQRLTVHSHKVAHGVEGRLRSLIQSQGEGISRAIARIWKGALMDDLWKFMPENDQSWAYNKTVESENQISQSVHYNIITGELLVDGRPLGRVPKSFMQHPLYQRTFGTTILRVFVSDMPGMMYMTARTIKDRQVHMGMVGDQLLIRTRDAKHTLELVPFEVFAGDLPHHFRSDFAHWLNLQTADIEFRPTSNLWESLPKNWRLFFSITSNSFMTQSRRSLVDVRSRLRNTIIEILQGVDDGENIHVMDLDNCKIEVELPRSNLRFFVNNSGHLESKELDAIVDPDQSIGTLHGLKSRLILRDRFSGERSVLIPYGTVSTKGQGNHVAVTIDGSIGPRLRYFRYRVDRHLRKLRSPPEKLAELYLCYLHALTSFVRADSFTGRTGTEEALTILRGESLRGFSPLDNDTCTLLEQISELTPHREFYPLNLKVMQKVSWNDQLSQTSQHDEFYAAVNDIISHTSRFAMLYDGKATPLNSRGSSHLLERARKRNSTFRRLEFGGDIVEVADDAIYTLRDDRSLSDRGCRVFEVASLIKSWPSRLNVPSDLAQIMSGWGTISGYEDAFDRRSYDDLIRLSFPNVWGSLYNLCCGSTQKKDTYSLMFLFCPIAFGQANSQKLIRALLACAFSSGTEIMSVPPYSSFNLRSGHEPDCNKLDKEIRAARHPLKVSATGFPRGSWEDHERRRENKSAYEREVDSQIRSSQQNLILQWPCREPQFLSDNLVPRINARTASSACRLLFAEWYKNYEFMEHIREIQEMFNAMNCNDAFVRPPQPVPHVSQPLLMNTRLPSLLDLMDTVSAPNPRVLPPTIACHRQAIPNIYQGNYGELEKMISELESSSDVIQSEYGKDLRVSFVALKRDVTLEVPSSLPCAQSVLQKYKAHLDEHLSKVLEEIINSLRPENKVFQIAQQAGLWALVTPLSLLVLLSASHFHHLSTEWKRSLISLGEAISILQRAERLLHLAGKGDILAFYKEAENVGREGWTAMDFPDWLLMEIESNFLIRKIQARVAMEMISPFNQDNSVLQLNMGEGKSSVIIPMLAVALSDRTRIARVMTLKPLLKQTEYVLFQRLSGLVNRRLYYTPFSRKTSVNKDFIQDLMSIYRECKEKGGILLALPEQVLSFRLIGRERLAADRRLAGQLLDTDQWLQQNVRDILDESDEILDTRFQLVYTVGSQRMLDGQPDRWAVTQAVLSCIDKHLETISQSGGVDINRKEGSFPSLTFLRNTAWQELEALVIRDIIRGVVPAINFGHCVGKVLIAVAAFIRDRAVNTEDVALVEMNFAESAVMPILFVLRGLFAHQILLFSLQKKRWLVDYGLNPRRCLMAVPYRAKGVPSLSSEFGHPDVAILLTCLSYYYTGLTEVQLRQSFELISKDSDPTDEYARWCNTCPRLPNELRDLNGVNLEDADLCSQLFMFLRYNMAVANFFLSKVVFPQEGKEFAKKISSSGWDIPAVGDNHRTTGFSGTNDNRFLLPLSIKQQDLTELHKTNAEVLNLALRPENREFIYAKDSRGRRLSVSTLIRLVTRQNPPVHVLIDVGAQVLEMTNREVAEEWLSNVSNAKAAIFFDDHDEAQVLDRDGHVERLVASAFHNRLDDCLVYLDEFHTRGVDLNLPVKARAAVTLGPRLTKDRLVQACMRMRKLGCGQSLLFIAPPDLKRKAMNETQGHNDEFLNSGDVIRWSLQQTCNMTEAMRPLWVIQGLEHCKRTRAGQELQAEQLSLQVAVSDIPRVTRYWEEIQEREALSLAEMYGTQSDTINPLQDWHEEDPVSRRLVQMWKQLDTSIARDSSMHEEQEREVAHEIERQRQVQRPQPAKPSQHSIHPDVIHYLKCGTIPRSGRESSFTPAFTTMLETSAGPLLDLRLDTSGMNIYVTQDFITVVKQKKDLHKDEYLRSVNWILSSTRAKEILIISPYEADRLFERIEAQSLVQLHVYTPRITRSMISFDDLQFYTVAAALVVPIQSLTESSSYCLGLFAGSLYLNDIATYKKLSGFLGITLNFVDEADGKVLVDRFVDSTGRTKLGWTIDCPFETCPIPFLKALISLRMKGQGYMQSHLGGLIYGRLLTEENFIC